MKRLFKFALPQVAFASQPLTFADSEGGFECDMMIFSTAYNRNKAYFQVSQLMKWADKLESTMFNFNHDLNLSEAKYLGNRSKFTKLWPKWSGGDLEIWATFKTTDSVVVSKKNEITAPSIELMVDDKNLISDENGEYFTDFDWVGCALLLGVVAGSGNARIGEIKDFNHLKNFGINNHMNKEEIQALLDMQAEQLTATFKAGTDELEAKFAKVGEVVDQYKSQSISTSVYSDEEGNKYETNSVSIWESVTTLIEKGEVSGSLMELMRAKGFTVTAFEAVKTPEELETEEAEAELTKIENSIKASNNRADLIKKFKFEKQVGDRENDAPKVVLDPKFSFNQSILNN